MLVLTISEHEAIRIGEAVVLVKKNKHGSMRLVVDAPKHIKVNRLPLGAVREKEK